MKTNSLYPLFMCASHKYPRNTKEALKNGYHFSMPLLCATKKLLIRPMLMRGRAQAFCFDESARGSRRSGMSVSSRKGRYSHSCHQDF